MRRKESATLLSGNEIVNGLFRNRVGQGSISNSTCLTTPVHAGVVFCEAGFMWHAKSSGGGTRPRSLLLDVGGRCPLLSATFGFIILALSSHESTPVQSPGLISMKPGLSRLNRQDGSFFYPGCPHAWPCGDVWSHVTCCGEAQFFSSGSLAHTTPRAAHLHPVELTPFLLRSTIATDFFCGYAACPFGSRQSVSSRNIAQHRINNRRANAMIAIFLRVLLPRATFSTI